MIFIAVPRPHAALYLSTRRTAREMVRRMPGGDEGLEALLHLPMHLRHGGDQSTTLGRLTTPTHRPGRTKAHQGWTLAGHLLDTGREALGIAQQPIKEVPCALVVPLHKH